MDVFPTMLTAAGGNPSAYELDGIDILPYVAKGEPLPDRNLYWEQGDQLAMRCGEWKLVLNGRLVEGAPPEDAVHLSKIDEDMSENRNLKDAQTHLVAEFTHAVKSWHAGIEERWEREFSVKKQGKTSH